MNLTAGSVFSLGADNPPTPGCTTSESIHHAEGISIANFSLAAGTDISAETYDYHKLLLVGWGEAEAYVTGGSGFAAATGTSFSHAGVGDAYLTPINVPVGVRTQAGTVYTEVSLERGTYMNELLKAGEVTKLADLLPYREGKIVNMDLAYNDKMKLALMSFGAGTGLDEHSAPGEALVFALDGEGVIGYEGQEHVIHAGENFKFDKGGRHFVRADKPFKMALLLTL